MKLENKNAILICSSKSDTISCELKEKLDGKSQIVARFKSDGHYTDIDVINGRIKGFPGKRITIKSY